MTPCLNVQYNLQQSPGIQPLNWVEHLNSTVEDSEMGNLCVKLADKYTVF